MGLRFIFMLTRNDRTVEDAEAQLATALGLGVRHIGFKDIGLPIARLKALNAAISAGGATSYLEVVSLDRESEIASATAALEIGVDILLGGTRVADVLPIVRGTSVRYCPFPGRIVGHPSVLEGSIDEIVASAVAMAEEEGVHGLDLLAYRSKEDVPELIRAVCAAVDKPVYVAGSIDTPEQIAAIRAAGAAGFTIGTAALDGKYPAGGQDVQTQLSAIICSVASLNDHLSSFHTERLAQSVAHHIRAWAPKIPGEVNDMRIQLLELAAGVGGSWTFHAKHDELLLVDAGRLQVRFRDREETVGEGEIIVVPRGVEHRLIPVDGACRIAVLVSASGETAHA